MVNHIVIFVLILPLLIIISALILLLNGWPIFYKQERIGQHGKKFMMYKFRTMKKNNNITNEDLWNKNEAPFPFFKIKNDPRVTRFGRFLRKMAWDELPQIINILKGDMDIVGVRPVLESEVKYLSDSYYKYKPGFTGPTQIYKNRRIELDEYNFLNDNFVKNYSLLLKIKIIIQSFKVFNKGM